MLSHPEWRIPKVQYTWSEEIYRPLSSKSHTAYSKTITWPLTSQLFSQHLACRAFKNILWIDKTSAHFLRFLRKYPKLLILPSYGKFTMPETNVVKVLYHMWQVHRLLGKKSKLHAGQLYSNSHLIFISWCAYPHFLTFTFNSSKVPPNQSLGFIISSYTYLKFTLFQFVPLNP